MKQKTNHMKKVSVGLQNISPKTFAAVALVSLMLLLWGRVLLTGKNGPSAAKASQPQTAAEAQAALPDTPAPLEVVAVTLPVISGRHDRLAGNPFSADRWTAYAFYEKEAEPAVEVVKPVTPEIDPAEQARRRHQADLDKIAQRLCLEAVIQDADGNPSKAYVNNKVLSVGTVLTVQEGPETYALTLTELSHKEASFTWNEFSVVLKITQPVNP